METQAIEPSIPPSEHIPTHHEVPHKPQPKFNKYLAIIVILAIIVTLLFYFNPLPHKLAEEVPENITHPAGNNTLEAELPEFTGNVSVLELNIPASLALGSPLSVSFNVSNAGNTSIDDVLFTAKLDDVSVYASQITDFAVNATNMLGFTFTSTDKNYPAAGPHTLKIFAGNKRLYSNDFDVVERLIAPNLEVRSFSTTPVTNIHIGDDVTLTAYIRDVGLADSDNSTIRFYVNGELLKEESAAIAQQITTPFKATWAPTAAGDYMLKVVAYASGDVYTDNNEYAMTITVENSTG